eukprot:CAMPEP_0176188460 /NCGR_PEP_ID=MMETSP0121_2-20121125/2927_1 /TAXON_ID=160619 /ORGANISM="Kryptoperidinium foliaceum, Strain CCMP 1326" /LENGTH=49 /DNA_ID= /DNA_START= /DNA_END= /DNA_ORIENTATION=
MLKSRAVGRKRTLLSATDPASPVASPLPAPVGRSSRMPVLLFKLPTVSV